MNPVKEPVNLNTLYTCILYSPILTGYTGPAKVNPKAFRVYPTSACARATKSVWMLVPRRLRRLTRAGFWVSGSFLGF